MMPGVVEDLKTTELLNAFEASMLSFELIGKNNQEVRTSEKFRMPSYNVDIINVLDLCLRLGGEFLMDFATRITVTTSSPHLLQKVLEQIVGYLSEINKKPFSFNIALLPLQPILKETWKCYRAAIQQKMFRLTESIHDEVIGLILDSTTSFFWTQDGRAQFFDLMSKIHRESANSPDFYQKLNNALHRQAATGNNYQNQIIGQWQ